MILQPIKIVSLRPTEFLFHRRNDFGRLCQESATVRLGATTEDDVALATGAKRPAEQKQQARKER